ncbi:hypothetical protein EXU57_03375 [Segetibacter sp. 3557_3]|uniref:hypothetical protein n=1 Tax=Segetibacter sp. 3557_3 TaxID=2547429 RepID=UPI001058C81D|nr:hypothetical protein [Segetibacter sp. 3557_3]TDH29121.1 hypothetical protein EXU57_03375 [Segetibacter sp. 3557_3]
MEASKGLQGIGIRIFNNGIKNGAFVCHNLATIVLAEKSKSARYTTIRKYLNFSKITGSVTAGIP